jgi:hypothetical protein
MKRKNWTNTDAQGLSDAHNTGRPLIGSDFQCARLARDTRENLLDIHLIRPALVGSWGLGPHSLVPPVFRHSLAHLNNPAQALKQVEGLQSNP